VYIDLDCAGQAAGGGIVEVGRAPAAVPVVCWRVLVCDGYEGELRVVFDGEDTVGGFGVVLARVGSQALDEALAVACQRSCCMLQRIVCSLHKVLVLALCYVALYRAGLLCRVVEVEGALCLDIVVSPVTQRVVGADQDLGAAAGQFGGGELLLVVLLISWCELGLDILVLDDRLDRLGDVRKLRRVSNAMRRWGAEQIIPRQEVRTL
jgi:hypothetical protein